MAADRIQHALLDVTIPAVDLYPTGRDALPATSRRSCCAPARPRWRRSTPTASYRDRPAQEIADTLFAIVRRHANGELRDDATLLVLRAR